MIEEINTYRKEIAKQKYLARHVTDQSRERNWWFVHFAHKKPLQYHRTEVASCPPHQKPIKLIKIFKQTFHISVNQNKSKSKTVKFAVCINLDEKLKVDIIGSRCSPLGLLAFSTSNKIYTLESRNKL